jgi:hypothetical protein
MIQKYGLSRTSRPIGMSRLVAKSHFVQPQDNLQSTKI